MSSSIRAFWQRLENSVHPDDKPYFKAHKHCFNLDFPPPAFIGDVDNAPVVFLHANGGYSPEKTRAQFPCERDRKEYLDWLWGDRKKFPCNLARYYTMHPFAKWLENGKAVIVNAVAYRSPRISKERENRKLAKILPSYKVTKKWFTEELLPAVRKNQRFVVMHRPKLWCLDRLDTAGLANFVYSPNPRSPYPAKSVLYQACRWFDERRLRLLADETGPNLP